MGQVILRAITLTPAPMPSDSPSSDLPSSGPPQAAPALAMLQALAVPVMHLGPQGQPQWANEAAVRALAWTPGQSLAELWADAGAAQSLCAAQGATADLQTAGAASAGGDWFRVSSQPLPNGGWVLSLSPLEELRSQQAEVTRSSELLDLARDFGRLGVWERNIRTLQGRWDREVLRFWGLDPDAPTPDFAQAIKNILEIDRVAANRYFQDSLKQKGRYSVRYRVRAPDGTVRRIHSQWLVKNGADGQPEHILGLMMDDSEPYALARWPDEVQAQLALAVELGDIAIWRHDLKTGRVHLNEQGWRSLGLKPQDQGLGIEEMRQRVHPDDLQRLLESARLALYDDRPVDLEARYRSSDDQWRAHLLRRVVLRDNTGQAVAFLGVALDITERQEQQRRASEMARQFDTVMRVAGIGHWLIEPGQQLAHWSDQLRLIYAWPAGQPVPAMVEWLQRCVHADDRAHVKDKTRAWLESSAERMELSFRALRVGGEVRHLLSHSQREKRSDGVLSFGVVIDITEQRRSELALRGAEQRVALAVRGAGLAAWEMDLDTGEVHWDEQMWRLRGLTPQAQPLNEAQRLACVHPEDREGTTERMQQAHADGATVELEFRVIWPDGELRWLASRSTELHDPASQRRRRIGVNWDISDRRSAQTVRQEREMALRDSASKSQFLSRMSHELRTPLNAVLGFSQLLLNDQSEAAATPAQEQQRRQQRQQRLQHIHHAGEHLLSLINDVLDLSTLEGGEVRIALQTVALAPLVEQTLPLLGPLQQLRGVKIELGALDLHVQADPTRLRQALLNLLSNAVKYNREGGSVSVQALHRGEHVLLRVADTGHGMSDEQLHQLFEPFNRLGADRGSIEGTGIGLAIVKALVERMGGSIHVDSRLGQGSVFELRLLAAGADSADGSAQTRAPIDSVRREPLAALGSGKDSGKRTVLYIEDNPVNALIIGELLSRRADLVLHVASDGSSGVAQAKLLQPELILLDMQLPDFDGYEVLRRLQADPATADIRCIALSANAMPEDITRALRAGVSDYWTKPLDFAAFMLSLEGLFGQAP